MSNPKDWHAQGQHDHVEGKYEPPHQPGVEIPFVTDWYSDKEIEDRNEYRAGWGNAEKNK
jgi:hypothetical protein